MKDQTDTQESTYQPRPPRSERFNKREDIKPQEAKQEAHNNAKDTQQPERVDLAALFKDDGSENSEGNVSDSKPVEDINHVGKRLGLTAEQVYSLKVPMPDGAEPLTIGALKDKVKELVNLETRETQFEARRIKSEGDLIKSQNEVRDLLAMLPKEQITEAMVEKVRKRQDAVLTRERRLTLEHIPEWEDDETRATEVKAISDFMQEYGFDETFITTVQDHRALRFLRIMWQRDQRIKKALANVKTPERRDQRPSGKASKPAVKPSDHVSRRRPLVPDNRTRIMSVFKE